MENERPLYAFLSLIRWTRSGRDPVIIPTSEVVPIVGRSSLQIAVLHSLLRTPLLCEPSAEPPGGADVLHPERHVS